MFDLHMHTEFSHDGKGPLIGMAEKAEQLGYHTIGFTDHVDLDDVGKQWHSPPCDVSARNREIDRAEALHPHITILRGAEISLDGETSAKATQEWLSENHLDFVIGSVHSENGMPTYLPEYYGDRSKKEVITGYLSTIVQRLQTCSFYDVMGHYDFAIKHGPWEDLTIRYADAYDLFDSIFRYLVAQGKGMEINTSPWRNRTPWGLDVITRYRELGGEILTVGSDAHSAQALGSHIQEALEMAKAAGFRYITTFCEQKPVFHPLP